MGGGAARGGRFSPALRDVRRLPSPPARGPSERSVCRRRGSRRSGRSEEHTSELQSLMRISYAVFCLKKKKTKKYTFINKSHIKQHTRPYTLATQSPYTHKPHI